MQISRREDVLERLKRLFVLETLLEEAYTQRDVDACVKIARELRAAAESYAKVAGWLLEGSAASAVFDQRQQVIAVMSGLSTEELRAIAHGKPISALSRAPAVLDGGSVSERSPTA